MFIRNKILTIGALSLAGTVHATPHGVLANLTDASWKLCCWEPASQERVCGLYGIPKAAMTRIKFTATSLVQAPAEALASGSFTFYLGELQKKVITIPPHSQVTLTAESQPDCVAAAAVFTLIDSLESPEQHQETGFALVVFQSAVGADGPATSLWACPTTRTRGLCDPWARLRRCVWQETRHWMWIRQPLWGISPHQKETFSPISEGQESATSAPAAPGRPALPTLPTLPALPTPARAAAADGLALPGVVPEEPEPRSLPGLATAPDAHAGGGAHPSAHSPAGPAAIHPFLGAAAAPESIWDRMSKCLGCDC
jgi:hypothetical protein